MTSDLATDLQKSLKSVTKSWKKAKDGEDRIARSALNRQRRASSYRVTIRDAAFEVMERAYNHASSNGRYYANARQIMYAARPYVLQLTGGECWKDSAYFTQTLLKDYIEQGYAGADWKIVWDARGHLAEPHTGRSVDLGGIEVMNYLRKWTPGDSFEVTPIATVPERIDTTGPRLRFSSALFIEKEGFDHILKDAGLADRYDLALFSSKGVPVKAVCDVSRAFHDAGLKVFVARDFDLAGFKIAETMRAGTRLAQGTPVIDLGLGLADAEAMELESEPVDYKQKTDPRNYLRSCGATPEERAFLVEDGSYWGGWWGQRVELNAMTSEQIIEWLEGGLEEYGVEKVIPDDDVLGLAYQRALYRTKLEEAARRLAAETSDVTDVPTDLTDRVLDYLTDNPAESWDQAIAAIAEDEE